MSGDTARDGRRLARVTATAVLLVLTALAIGGPGTGDMEIWERWISNARRLGIVAGFAENGADYPPLSSVFLWVAGLAGSAFRWDPGTAIKISLAVFLGFTLLAFLAWTRRGAATLGLWAALLLNSVALGYLDVYTAPFLVLSLRALSAAEDGWALTWFGVACLVKWQPGLIAPFLLLHAFGGARRPTIDDLRRVVRLLMPTAAIALALALAFGVMPFVLSFARSLGHRSLSAEALNLGWLITWIHQGVMRGSAALFDRVVYLPRASLWLRVAMRTLFVGQFLVLMWRYARGPAVCDRTLAFAFMGSLAYITFSSGVHENHWFLPCLLVMALSARNTAWRWPAAATCALANLNLLLFYGVTGQGPGDGRVVGIDVTVPLAALAVAFYAWMWTIVRRQDARYSSIRQ